MDGPIEEHDDFTLRNTEHIMKICRNCKHLQILHDGEYEEYWCCNDDRLEQIADEYDDEYGDTVGLIGVARVSVEGRYFDFDWIDFDFPFDKCKFKEKEKTGLLKWISGFIRKFFGFIRRKYNGKSG